MPTGSHPVHVILRGYFTGSAGLFRIVVRNVARTAVLFGRTELSSGDGDGCCSSKHEPRKDDESSKLGFRGNDVAIQDPEILLPTSLRIGESEEEKESYLADRFVR